MSRQQTTSLSHTSRENVYLSSTISPLLHICPCLRLRDCSHGIRPHAIGALPHNFRCTSSLRRRTIYDGFVCRSSSRVQIAIVLPFAARPPLDAHVCGFDSGVIERELTVTQRFFHELTGPSIDFAPGYPRVESSSWVQITILFCRLLPVHHCSKPNGIPQEPQKANIMLFAQLDCLKEKICFLRRENYAEMLTAFFPECKYMQKGRSLNDGRPAGWTRPAGPGRSESIFFAGHAGRVMRHAKTRTRATVWGRVRG